MVSLLHYVEDAELYLLLNLYLSFIPTFKTEYILQQSTQQSKINKVKIKTQVKNKHSNHLITNYKFGERSVIYHLPKY